MIKADRLDYKEITSALLAGNFYSSRGPEIYSLTYDTGAHTVTVECSNGRKDNLYARHEKTADRACLRMRCAVSEPRGI